MGNIFSHILQRARFHYQYRLFLKQWNVGIVKGDIREIIRSKKFDRDICWLPVNGPDHQQADPFFLQRENGTYELLIEDVVTRDGYGKIAWVQMDKHFRRTGHAIVLDTESHLSYPYIFRDNGKVYLFPESSEAGKLSCYTYDPVTRSAAFAGDILDLPLLDTNVIRWKGKYWIIGVTREKGGENYELQCFFSRHLTGPYTAHPGNPLLTGLDGTRAAGNFIEVDGEWYRPAQNCREEYGKSISIYRVKRLDETGFEQEFHMQVEIDKKNRTHRGMRAIHTINVMDDLIAVDGVRWTFSPLHQHREVMEEKARFRESEKKQSAG